MKKDFSRYIIDKTATILDAIKQINEFSAGQALVLFVLNENEEIIGSLTDGDIRRGFIRGVNLEDSVVKSMNESFHYIENLEHYEEIKWMKEDDLKIIPHITQDKKIIDFIELKNFKAILPLDAVIMAGGQGVRLKPYTNDIPKPMLELNGKPIIAHNIDRLIQYGIQNIYISVNHLKEQIKEYINSRYGDLNIQFVEETTPLGTVGSLSLIKKFLNDDVLLMNADVLTNIDFEDFYINFKNFKDDMSVATFNIKNDIPYAVLETEGKRIKSFIEKPTYTYYSNAGIYLFHKEIAKKIPKNTVYDAIDLMEKLIAEGKKVTHFPIRGYWLDIGTTQNYSKAKDDVKYIKF